MRTLPFSLLQLAILFKFSESSRVCRAFAENAKHEFHPLRHCQRSNKTVIASTDVGSAEQCADFARRSRALAFNFSPASRRGVNHFESSNVTKTPSDFSSCEALACPEYQNFSSVVNDTRFDYYSMYTHPAPILNATCIESLGMFVLYRKRQNYASAVATCASINGQLAHVVSERRTNELSRLLGDSLEAFVGLNETTRGKFITSNAEPLECFDYRAFAPGHPPEIRKPSCVLLTKRSAWRVASCTRKNEFICELLSSGPSPYVNNLGRMCSAKRPNNRFAPRRMKQAGF